MRTLRREAGFTTFAVGIVGLGIGATATVFSVVNAVLLRPRPFAIRQASYGSRTSPTTVSPNGERRSAIILDLRTRSQSLSDLAGYYAYYGVGDSNSHGTEKRNVSAAFRSPATSCHSSACVPCSADRSPPRNAR
jgi:hypothetical protein